MKKNKVKNSIKFNRHGISLIVLIITVIVVIILAAAVILTISKNNPIDSSKEAVFKEDVRNFQDSLLLTISKQYLDNQGNRDYKITTQNIPTTFDEMKTYILNYTKKYDKKLGIKNDELVYFPDEVTENEKKWLEDLGIKPWIIEEASSDIFIWEGTKITGYNEVPLKTYLANNNNILKIPGTCKTLGSGAFQDCDSLVDVIIPDSVTQIESAAFILCSNLKNVILPNSITEIGDSTFSGCISLKNITIPSNVTNLRRQSFSNCKSLTNIIIPDNVNYIGSYVFDHCTNLTTVIIGKNVKTISSSAFRDCTSLIDITIPDSVENIGAGAFNDTPWYKNKEDGLVYINNILYAYKGEMPKNSNIVIKDGTKRIVGNAFYKRTNLISVTIPNSVISIGDDVFHGCTSLTNITLPENLKSIGWNEFSECINLTSITIPNSVTSIGEYAFYNCTNLNNINFNGTKEQWENITKSSSWKSSSNITTITCTDGIINLE